MSQITALAAATTPSVTVVYSHTLSITTIDTMATNTMGLLALSQHDVDLLLLLILRDTVRGSVCLTNLPQQQQPQSQMPSKTNATYAMDPCSSELSL